MLCFRGVCNVSVRFVTIMGVVSSACCANGYFIGCLSARFRCSLLFIVHVVHISSRIFKSHVSTTSRFYIMCKWIVPIVCLRDREIAVQHAP